MDKEKAISEYEAEIESLINQRRRQILVHSCMYYRMDNSVVDDRTFDIWARQLVSLQRSYPDIATRCVYADAFKDFDGSTGYDLPLEDDWVVRSAYRYLELYHKFQDHPRIIELKRQIENNPLSSTI